MLSPEMPRLPRVEAGAKAPENSGTVTVNFDDGYLLLAPEGSGREHGTRLVWKRGEKETPRPLAPGRYLLYRYVVSRLDDQKVEWTLNASGKQKIIEVKPGEETRVNLDLSVTLAAKLVLKKGRVVIGGAFRGDGGMPLTVIRGERRIPAAWAVLIGGREVASGEAPYG